MMLADHAQVADGKLFISGGGWTACGPGPSPCAVAVLFHVPWQETGDRVSFTLRLIDEDGHGVFQPGAQDDLPVQVNGHFEARRPPGMLPGAEINVPMTFNIVLHLAPGRGGLQLGPGRRRACRRILAAVVRDAAGADRAAVTGDSHPSRILTREAWHSMSSWPCCYLMKSPKPGRGEWSC